MKYNLSLIAKNANQYMRDGLSRSKAWKYAWDEAKGLVVKDASIVNNYEIIQDNNEQYGLEHGTGFVWDIKRFQKEIKDKQTKIREERKELAIETQRLELQLAQENGFETFDEYLAWMED